MKLSQSSASVERIFSLFNHAETKTNSLKQKLLRKVVGNRSIIKKPEKRLWLDPYAEIWFYFFGHFSFIARIIFFK